MCVCALKSLLTEITEILFCEPSCYSCLLYGERISRVFACFVGRRVCDLNATRSLLLLLFFMMPKGAAIRTALIELQFNEAH